MKYTFILQMFIPSLVKIVVVVVVVELDADERTIKLTNQPLEKNYVTQSIDQRKEFQEQFKQ